MSPISPESRKPEADFWVCSRVGGAPYDPPMAQTTTFELAGKRVALGKARDIEVPVGESATGRDIVVPTRVWRGKEPGPIVAITAAVHGDEINGVGVVRQLLIEPPFELLRGTLILVPVINILGFERQSRYMPDRRDLNRSFPGSASGSLTARFAHAVFDQIVKRADWLIDLHAAAARRTNFPNVRADLDHPQCAELAAHFTARGPRARSAGPRSKPASPRSSSRRVRSGSSSPVSWRSDSVAS